MQGFQNHLLCEVSEGLRSTLARRLELVRMRAEAIVQPQGEPAKFVHFIESGLVSIVRILTDGSRLEASVVGREGLIGSPVTAADAPASEQAEVIVAGSAWRISAERLHQLADEHTELRDVLGRHAQCLLDEARMNVACNAAHGLDQRLAKWLMRCFDRIDEDRLDVTQDFIADMLGVQRTTITLGMQRLTSAGIITTGRMRVELVDADRLRAIACDCYAESTERFAALGLPEPADRAECVAS